MEDDRRLQPALAQKVRAEPGPIHAVIVITPATVT